MVPQSARRSRARAPQILLLAMCQSCSGEADRPDCREWCHTHQSSREEMCNHPKWRAGGWCAGCDWGNGMAERPNCKTWCHAHPQSIITMCTDKQWRDGGWCTGCAWCEAAPQQIWYLNTAKSKRRARALASELWLNLELNVDHGKKLRRFEAGPAWALGSVANDEHRLWSVPQRSVLLRSDDCRLRLQAARSGDALCNASNPSCCVHPPWDGHRRCPHIDVYRPFHDILEHKDPSWNACPKVLGLTLSFMALLEHILSHPGYQGLMLVLEDDVQVSEAWRRNYDAFLRERPVGTWHLAKLTGGGPEPSASHRSWLRENEAAGNHDFWRRIPHAMWGTAAILFHTDQTRRILNALRRRQVQPHDGMLQLAYVDGELDVALSRQPILRPPAQGVSSMEGLEDPGVVVEDKAAASRRVVLDGLEQMARNTYARCSRGWKDAEPVVLTSLDSKYLHLLTRWFQRTGELGFPHRVAVFLDATAWAAMRNDSARQLSGLCGIPFYTEAVDNPLAEERDKNAACGFGGCPWLTGASKMLLVSLVLRGRACLYSEMDVYWFESPLAALLALPRPANESLHFMDNVWNTEPNIGFFFADSSAADLFWELWQLWRTILQKRPSLGAIGAKDQYYTEWVLLHQEALASCSAGGVCTSSGWAKLNRTTFAKRTPDYSDPSVRCADSALRAHATVVFHLTDVKEKLTVLQRLYEGGMDRRDFVHWWRDRGGCEQAQGTQCGPARGEGRGSCRTSRMWQHA